MAKRNGILDLHRKGWSQRQIEKVLGIDHNTMGAHLAAEASKRAKAPTGSGDPSEAPIPIRQQAVPADSPNSSTHWFDAVDRPRLAALYPGRQHASRTLAERIHGDHWNRATIARFIARYQFLPGNADFSAQKLRGSLRNSSGSSIPTHFHATVARVAAVLGR